MPKCKSKAYRKQKKEEAEALAAALAAALATKEESPSEASAASPTSDTEPVQSPKVSTPSCAAAPLLGRGQEVHLQPGQQTIILVCGCGARTTLQISHTESVSAQVALPVAPQARSEVSLPVANLAVSEAGEREASAVVPVEPKVAVQGSTGREPAIANPVSMPAAAPVSPGAEEAISKSTHVEGAASVAKAIEPPVATTPVALTSSQPAPQVATAAADRATPQQSTAPEAAPTWDDDLPDPIPFTV